MRHITPNFSGKTFTGKNIKQKKLIVNFIAGDMLLSACFLDASLGIIIQFPSHVPKHTGSCPRPWAYLFHYHGRQVLVHLVDLRYRLNDPLYLPLSLLDDISVVLQLR